MTAEPNANQENAEWRQLLEEFLAEMEFGEIKLIVHKGCVTGVEYTKRRQIPGLS